MYDAVPLMPIATALPVARSLDSVLGQIHIATTGRIFRLCKANSAITSCASKGVVSAYSAGVPTWVVDLPAAVVTDNLLFVPASQTGSTGTSDFVASDYFYALTNGRTTFLAANTTLVQVEGQRLAVNTSGQVAAITAVTTASTVSFGSRLQATNTAAATAAGQAITGYVTGIF